jgi:choline dehydrogenase-like flavoprotein
MHIDARTVEAKTIIKTNICIAGAGAAGISLATRLAQSALDICVLEAGGLNSGGNSQSLYIGENVGQSYYPLDSCRLRFFGGTTNHWAGYCAPLDPSDFNKREWVPHSGWPISWMDIREYYDQAREVCQLQPFSLSHWQDVIRGFTPWPLKPSKLQTQVFQVHPLRFGREYRDEILRSDNITLYTHANVTEIQTTEAAKSVEQFRVSSLNGNSFFVQADRYVLACGGIENPRLLLLSDRHSSRGIGNGNDLVGRFFMEHPGVASASVLRADDDSFFPYWRQQETEGPAGNMEVSFRLAIPHARQKDLEISNARINVGTTTSFESVKNLYDGFREERLQFGDDLGDIADDVWRVFADFEGVASGINQVLRGDSVTDRSQILELVTWIEQSPNPESRVTLGRNRDELGLRRVELDWQLSSLDYRTIYEINRIAAQELARVGFGRTRLHRWLLNEEPEWPSDLRGGNHHMGTTRMSTSPERGVCTPDCRVYGVENLYLAGSSVFPTVGHAYPTLTIVALSLRLADHLITDLRK